MAETAWRSFKKDKKKPGFNPSLNTQSCNKGLLGVRNFGSTEKKFGPIMSNF